MNNPLLSRLWRLIVLAVLGFGPLTLMCGLVSLIGVFGLLFSDPGARFESTVFLAVPLVLLGCCLLGCDALLQRTHQLWSRALVFYIGWLTLLSLPLYMLLTALAGVSMASVDGLVTDAEGYLDLLSPELLNTLGSSHLLIVPWVIGVALLLPRVPGFALPNTR